MKSDIHVASPPPKPLLVYDGDCNFCLLWVRRWQQIMGDGVDCLPSQDPRIAADFPEIPPENFAGSVQLIETDGTVHAGAQAVFRSLAKNPRCQWPLRLYENVPAFAKCSESVYYFIARHRTFFSWLTRCFWGRHVELPDYFLTRWIFLRALGMIYLVAFVSFWMQASGLIGHNGILPAQEYVTDIRLQCQTHGIGLDRYHLLPTLCWWGASDHFLNVQCAVGTGLAVLLVVGIAPAPCLVLLWVLYLSLVTIGRDFFGFQWDNLLLEAGFLAIFLAPLQWLPRFSQKPQPSRLVIWLLRLLLFKLMFSSGCVKLLSGDPTWRDLTALTYHYETQPLPTWIGWYAAQLPLWFQKLSCAVMFIVEIGVPFLIFLPRRIRLAGCGAMMGLQILILLTGNYTFFNFLTLALYLLLLDDFVLRKFTRKKLTVATPGSRPLPHWPRLIIIPLSIVIFSLSLFQIFSMLGWNSRVLTPVAAVDRWLAPLRTENGYGLFRVMTTERREIIVEGSDDGTNWLAYDFKYKPGDLKRPPSFIEPFQPRLDWQMWFAALGDYSQNPWFENFCVRLLQGSPTVLALLDKNPFPGKPPRYIRAELYDYHFTTLAERRRTGDWWQREFIGEYLPPVSLRE